MRAAVALALGAVLSASSGLAAPVPPAPPASESTTVQEITVTAPAEAKAVAQFVDAITAPTTAGRVARWDRKVCPGVLGLKPEAGNFLNDTIARVAYEVGLEVGEPGCKPNIIVFVTPESDTFTSEIVANRPAAFAKYNAGGSKAGRGRNALKSFVETPKAVRWWHVVETVGADGQPLSGEDKSVRVRDASRLRSNVRDDFSRVIVVVDAKRIQGVRFGAIANYLAMVTLAQISPDAEAKGSGTILTLFADRDAGIEPETKLTERDVAYLRGLYSTDPSAKNAARAKNQIGSSMRR